MNIFNVKTTKDVAYIFIMIFTFVAVFYAGNINNAMLLENIKNHCSDNIDVSISSLGVTLNKNAIYDFGKYYKNDLYSTATPTPVATPTILSCDLK